MPSYRACLEPFDRGDFFAACLALDQAWQAEPTDLCQGLIFLAAGFHHLQGGRPAPGRQLLELALEYLRPHALCHPDLNLPGAMAVAARTVQALRDPCLCGIHTDGLPWPRLLTGRRAAVRAA